MTIETWATFISVVFVFAIIPGPTVILVVAQTITHGKKSVAPLVAGVLAGDFVAMSLSLAGLGAILAASATLYAILKWFGIAYLVYLGIKIWREDPKIDSISFEGVSTSNREMFQSSFVVTALNPKDIIFFVAFLPQFVNPQLDIIPQFMILMVSFLGIVSITITSFAVFAGSFQHKIQAYEVRKRFNKIGGGALVGASVLASTVERN